MRTHPTPPRPLPLPCLVVSRPEAMDAIVGQEEVVRVLQRAAATGHLPHLLLYGPPGTGKTSTILALARQLYGPALAGHVLQLNASDDSSIAVMRNRVKTFAAGGQAAAQKLEAKGLGAEPRALPPFRLIILDEADMLAETAQAALRRMMETTVLGARFCFVCNYVTRIIEPLASRCLKLRFGALPADAVVAKLGAIAAAEGMTLPTDTAAALHDVAAGDMRRAVTALQSAALLHEGPGAAILTPGDVADLAGMVPPEVLEPLWAAVCAPDVRGVVAAMAAVRTAGYPGRALLQALATQVAAATPPLACTQLAHAFVALARVDHRLADGGDEHLQLLAVCLRLQEVLAGAKGDGGGGGSDES
jgi:replication factor C subunit 2/4